MIDEEKKDVTAETPPETPKEASVESADLFATDSAESGGFDDVFGGEDEPIPSKKQTQETATSKRKLRPKKKKAARQVPRGNVYVQATYNNTMVSITDLEGNVLAWSSAGKVGFQGPKKSTPYAAMTIIRDATQRVRDEFGMHEVDVFVKGIGPGRDSAVRALNANGFTVHMIKDLTPVPHNGCRPPKVRRV